MKVLSLLFLLWPLSLFAQLNEYFADGNFTADPAWTGDTAYWQITNGKLQSHFPDQDPDGTVFFHLSTASGSVKNTSWEFWIQLHFNTSGNNYVDVYLTSDQEDPRCGINNCNVTYGYFVRIGNTEDEVSLYRRDGSSNKLLVNGRDDITDHSNNILSIKITCDDKYRWTLYTDKTGTGNNYIREGTYVDSTYTKSTFFSIVIHQRGKTAAENHFFDDIIISPFLPDTIEPVVTEIFPVDEHHINLLFSETLNPKNAENILHYIADDGLNFPDSARLDNQNPKLVHLYFKKTIIAKNTYHLQIRSVTDFSGNNTDSVISFIYYQPHAYEVAIDEIFADPTPSKGLPEDEFIEIKNIAGYPVNLSGWKLCDKARCAVFPPTMLYPGSLLIVCDEENVQEFIKYGKTTGLENFPSLNNNGDELVLKNNNGKIIYAIAYDKSWYKNEEKDNGGWSLEMKDQRYPCLITKNWMTSVNPSGGTPGRVNSVTNIYDDAPILGLKYIQILDSMNIMAHFNLGLDSQRFSFPQYYLLNNNNIASAKVLPPYFNTVQLHLSVPLEKRKIYTLYIKNIEGCGHAKAGLDDHFQFGLPEKADSLDVVINEILFNPRDESHDFIELYNRSPKTIDMSTLQLANKDREANIDDVKKITTISYYLFPKSYVAITKDKKDLLKQYFCKDPKAILQAKDMPVYPNENGTVVLMNNVSKVIDEVHYDEDENYNLFNDNEGVSLERININAKSNDPANWHSASSVAGYATPTYLNSQSSEADTLSKAFSVQPEIFSPNGDGRDDQAAISWSLPPGYSGKILVYNETGKLIRQLLDNSLLGTHGKIFWDGKNDRSRILPTGIYIIYIEAFDLHGNLKRIKLPVVLVSGLN